MEEPAAGIRDPVIAASWVAPIGSVGSTPYGGGWVQMSNPVDTVLEACIFPDMSTIDSWGLTYHQAKIIRGKNLKGMLQYPDHYAK